MIYACRECSVSYAVVGDQLWLGEVVQAVARSLAIRSGVGMRWALKHAVSIARSYSEASRVCIYRKGDAVSDLKQYIVPVVRA